MSLLDLLKMRGTSLTDSLTKLLDLTNNAALSAEALDAEMMAVRRSYGCWSTLWARVESDTSLDSKVLLDCVTVYKKVEETYQEDMGKLYLHRSSLTTSQPTTNAGFSSPRLRLPDVKIEPFTGDIGDWEAWWTSFKDMVDDQPISSISVTAKYQLLMNSVDGDPKSLVRSHPATPAGYVAALDCLKEHYADPAMQRSRVLDSLINLEYKGFGSEGVMDFKTKVESLLQHWDSLNIDTTHPIVARLVLGKLPNKHRQKVFDLSDSVNPSYQQIKQALKTLWERQDFPDNKSDKKQRQDKDKDKDKDKGSTSSKPSSTQVNTQHEKGDKKEKKPRLCAFCQERTHTTCKCTKYVDVKSRQSRVKELNLCVKCTKTKHEGDCKPVICYFCKDAHHTWYHM